MKSVDAPLQMPATRRPPEEHRPAGPDTAFVLVLALAALKLIATLAVSDRYGFHRDELYYLACARHLALGFVDFPPLTPLLARLDELVFGVSLPGLRLLPALTGAAIIVLAARLARALGAGPSGQVLAAAAVLLNPLFLGANLLFQTVTFDQVVWLIVLSLVVRWLRTGDRRLWLAIGLACGIGLETKYTIAALLLGLVCAMLLTPARAQLRTPWPWLAAALALLLLVPNLLWQAQHDWASLAYLRTHQGNTGSRLSFLAETALLLGPLGLPLAALGVWELRAQARWRLLGWTCLVTTLLLFLANGKAYYVGPLYPVVLAAGAVRATALLTGPRGRIWTRGTVLSLTGALTLLSLLLVPLGLPVLPAGTMIHLGLADLRKDYADMFGWQELTTSVARVYAALPVAERRRTTIWALNYGEAGALDLYGGRYGLPPVISSHLTYYYWKPAHVDDRTVIVVGAQRSLLVPLFARISLVGILGNASGVRNEEVGRAIYVCRRPKVSLDHVWPSLRAFD